MTEWALRGLLIGLLGCSPEPILLADSGQSIPEDSGVDDTADPGPSYFEPVLFSVQEIMYRWDQGAFVDFRLEAGGTPQTSFMTIRFFSQEYLETGADGARCDWTTALVLREENTRGDPSVWTGMQLEPSTLETDCQGFDPETWEQGNPGEHMETASLWFGLGPLQSLGAVVQSLYDETGQSWEQDGEPYLFSVYFGLWDAESLGLIPEEVNYAVAYQADQDGVIQYDSSGTALMVEVGDQLPEGVVRSLPYHSPTIDELPP